MTLTSQFNWGIRLTCYTSIPCSAATSSRPVHKLQKIATLYRLSALLHPSDHWGGGSRQAQHARDEALIQLRWSKQIGATVSEDVVIPATSLSHLRPGWKIAVDVHPAPTSPGASTTVWSTIDAVSTAGEKQVKAGETMKIVVEARDTYGNHRGVGELPLPWYFNAAHGGKHMLPS